MNHEQQIEAGAKVLHQQMYDQFGGNPARWDLSIAQDAYLDDARAVYAAFHPTITTTEELDKLPIGSIVACMGTAPGTRNVPITLVWQRGSAENGGYDWCMPDTRGQITATDVFYFLNVNSLRQELAVLHYGATE